METTIKPQSGSLPVIISGAGLSGLALAQALKTNSIPFKLYERDPTPSTRAQGYRIRISPAGASALQRLLPTELYAAFEATCAFVGPEQQGGETTVDALSASPVNWGNEAPPIPKGKAFNADRAVLRALLMKGLEGEVGWGRRIVGFSEERSGAAGSNGADSGGVEVCFADGSVERGSCLIGADGVRSAIRKQLMPGLQVLDTEGRAIFGKTVATDELRSKVPALLKGMCLVGENEKSRMKFFSDIMVFDREQSAPFQKNLDLHLPADYLYWVLVFRKDELDDEDEKALHTLSNEQSAEKALDMTPNWHPALRELLSEQLRDAASTLSFSFSGVGFDEAWAEKAIGANGRVTLMGDAAHPVPPVGGIGANAVFQDAAELLDSLKELYATNQTEVDVLEALSKYEMGMRRRLAPVLQSTVHGAARMFGMKPASELGPVSW